VSLSPQSFQARVFSVTIAIEKSRWRIGASDLPDVGPALQLMAQCRFAVICPFWLFRMSGATARLDLAPQCAGLLAISLGLSHNFPNDHELLIHGFVVYDALYAWLKPSATKSTTGTPSARPNDRAPSLG
jgi:hypothetical protein